MMKLGGSVLYKNLGRVRIWASQPPPPARTHKNVPLSYDVGKISAGCLDCSSDLDLDQMTLTYKLHIGILKVYQYLHIKNEVSRSRLSKIIAQTGQTDRQTRPNALPSTITGGN